MLDKKKKMKPMNNGTLLFNYLFKKFLDVAYEKGNMLDAECSL